MWRKAVFVLVIVFLLSPYGSPPLALALGIALAFSLGNPFQQLTGKPTRNLLQISVVLLGFGMNLEGIYRAGRDGILFTVATIFGTLAVGYFVGKRLGVGSRTSSLISSGTAICGGSAIAAVAPAINAKSEEISISLGTVFVLNSIALFVFPLVGHAMGLSQSQFGIWAAIAVHDTSSVVGATGTYGTEALAVGTTVKLARALWIVPVALLFTFIYRREDGEGTTKMAVPWFIFLFLLAAVIRTYTPASVPPSIFDSLVNLAKAGMTVTLFLIGTSLTRSSLKVVGARPLLQGIILWVSITVAGLAAVIYFL